MNNSVDAERPLLLNDYEDHAHESHLQESQSHAASPSTLVWLTDHESQQPEHTHSQDYAHHPGIPRPQRPTSFVKRPTAQKAAQRARKTAWICIDSSAKRSFLHADKRAVIHGLGLHIPLRDMRLLDFNLLASESAKILVRDNAIIVSNEHIRLIITHDKALVPREATQQSPLSDRFVDVLEDAVADWARQVAAEQAFESTGGGGVVMTGSTSESSPFKTSTALYSHATPTDTDDETSASIRHEYQPLPFELVVLEAALKEMVASSAAAVKELEGVAHPALDALTKTVNSGNLERVRKVKTRHQRLLTRCEALREELQRFLGDDDDMAQMCLTRKIEAAKAAEIALQQQQQQEEQAAAGGGGNGGQHGQQPQQQQSSQVPIPMAQTTARQSGFHVGSLSRRSGFLPTLQRQSSYPSSPPRAIGGGGLARSSFVPGTSMMTSNMQQGGMLAAAMAYDDEAEADAEAQQDVENLLESYFMQVDGLFDKLVSIDEYIKDTEEYINIELDSSRNRLIRLEIVLTAATFALAPFNLLAGILGENLVIPEQLTRSVKGFYGLNAIAFACCFMFFYSIMMYMRYRKLL